MKTHKFTHLAIQLWSEDFSPEQLKEKGLSINEQGAVWFDVTAHYEVCPTCEGHGVHVRQDIDDSQLVDQMREDGDSDGLQDYKDGAFDVICTECKGQRVILIPDLSKIPEMFITMIEEWEEEVRESRRYAAMERAAGA